MRQYLPPPIFEEIQQHLIQEGNTAEAGWDAGEDEEDTLTGHLGARLQRDWSIPIRINDRFWRWRVQYKKFRGRGPGAFEKTSGADGIIQVEIDLIDEAESIFKAILFQAKKGDARTDRKITEQVEKMETMAPGGSAIFEYRPDQYRVIEGHSYL